MTLNKLQSVITVKKFYQTLAQIAKILFPQYPCYFFPSFLLIQVCKNIKQKGFRLLPAPRKLINLLTKGEFFKSDHYCFVSESIYDEYIRMKDLSWVNLTFNGTQVISNLTSSSSSSINDEDNIVQTILNKPNASILMPVISISNCQWNCVFVSENCYQNLLVKYKLKADEETYVSLQSIGDDQSVPRMASRATIFLIKHAYDLSFDATDEILNKYFSEPRIMYRNHTYEISFDDLSLDSNITAKYFSVFNDMKSIYFRCLHLESKDNPFEIMAVVMKGITTLHQTTSISYPIPRQCMDDLCCIPFSSWGLRQSFHELQSSLKPFTGDLNAAATPVESKSIEQKRNSYPNDSKLLSNGILPMFLIQGEPGTNRRSVVNAVARSLGIQQYKIHCADIVSSIPAQTEAKLKIALAKADVCEPLLVTLHNFEVFGVDHEGRGDPRILSVFQNEIGTLFSRKRRFPLLIVAITSDKIINPLIQRQFLDVIRIAPPDEQQRYDHFQWLFQKEIVAQEIFNKKLLENVPLFNGMDIERANKFLVRYFSHAKNVNIFRSVADKTKGFLYGDIKLLFDNCLRNILMNNRGEMNFDLKDIEEKLSKMQLEFSSCLGAPKVPKVLWSDIGGLIKLKDEIQSSIGLPLKHMHLMGKNMRRSGILLYGPPGTGKTLVAKAVATECNLSFLSVQGPELLNMYVGQSEQNVREVFARARSAAPCVIFLDELDSLAPNRGHAGDSGGVMDRVVSQLLAEMDGMTSNGEPQKQIFILAATNRPDLIDPALLRPGRFDKLLYVGPCKTIDDKIAVLKAQMKRFVLVKAVTIESIAELLIDDMTGADLYSICSNAWLSAVRRTITAHQNDEKSARELAANDVVVNFSDFQSAIKMFVPSISKKDMEYFNKLKENFNTNT